MEHSREIWLDKNDFLEGLQLMFRDIKGTHWIKDEPEDWSIQEYLNEPVKIEEETFETYNRDLGKFDETRKKMWDKKLQIAKLRLEIV